MLKPEQIDQQCRVVERAIVKVQTQMDKKGSDAQLIEALQELSKEGHRLLDVLQATEVKKTIHADAEV